MEISGSYEFNAPAEKVWGLLMDPKVLAKCLPGVESLDPIGPDEYQAVVNVGVGPIRGRYQAKIFLRDLNPHQSYRLVMQGSGPLGFANGE
ncbi:MAG TPA: carbon monoxide dehydrogenase subunit G, partial [Dehalococcoidia bacterium]|nr:carbon monoxide dehydrogenase subunit G [Dehalococcoidia bacterium]